MGTRHAGKICALSGPSFAREVAGRMPTAVTVAARTLDISEAVQHIFNNAGYFRVYSSTDLVGVEIGGAVKNVIALTLGKTGQREALWTQFSATDAAVGESDSGSGSSQSDSSHGSGGGLPAMLRMMEHIARAVHAAHFQRTSLQRLCWLQSRQWDAESRVDSSGSLLGSSGQPWPASSWPALLRYGCTTSDPTRRRTCGVAYLLTLRAP